MDEDRKGASSSSLDGLNQVTWLSGRPTGATAVSLRPDFNTTPQRKGVADPGMGMRDPLCPSASLCTPCSNQFKMLFHFPLPLSFPGSG